MHRLCTQRRIHLVIGLSIVLWATGCASTKGRMGRRHRRPDRAPALATQAPNFTLKTLKGEREVELASFRGAKPVVLVFGSYT